MPVDKARTIVIGGACRAFSRAAFDPPPLHATSNASNVTATAQCRATRTRAYCPLGARYATTRAARTRPGTAVNTGTALVRRAHHVLDEVANRILSRARSGDVGATVVCGSGTSPTLRDGLEERTPRDGKVLKRHLTMMRPVTTPLGEPSTPPGVDDDRVLTHRRPPRVSGASVNSGRVSHPSPRSGAASRRDPSRAPDTARE